jgi:hypothetical protein
MRNYIQLLFALLVACAVEQPEPQPEQTAPVSPAAGRDEHKPTMSSMQAASDHGSRLSQAGEDPYPGAEQWCYEVDDLMPCRREGDTSANELLPTACGPDPRTGRRRVCIDPWWVNGHERLCVPPSLTRREQKAASAELQAFIYRRENGKQKGICQPQSWWRADQGHSVEPGFCNPEPLVKLLRVVSIRESNYDQRRTHLLSRDQVAARSAYQRKRKLYEGVNPHYYAWARWRSRGPYGQNPALHLWRFDRKAPPEILCNRVIATEVYMETLRSCHPRLAQLRGGDPDWWDLHHCASGGSFSRPDVIDTSKGSFHHRAQRMDLDPYQMVPIEWLGKAISHDLVTVREIERKISPTDG